MVQLAFPVGVNPLFPRPILHIFLGDSVIDQNLTGK